MNLEFIGRESTTAPYAVPPFSVGQTVSKALVALNGCSGYVAVSGKPRGP